jgi:glycosyltransferase involved in cell wall biosynthesis
VSETDAGTGAAVEVSVVLPCLDEAETLATCIRKATQSMAQIGVRGEVVVADNGSTDGSQDIARQCGARVVDVPVRGYGAALRAGIAQARGRFVIMADADDSYALEDLRPFIEALRGGADLVMGNRFAGGIAPGAMPFLHRYLGNPVLSWLGRLFFRIPTHDFHCGMRGMRREAILGLGLRTNGMEFASEMVVRSALAAHRIVEVPTTLRPDGRSRSPHLRTWRDGWRHLRFLLAFSPRWLFLYPSLALIAVGVVAVLALFIGPVTFGDVSFDVQTMVVAASALILGTQGAGLALVTRAYAARLDLLPRSPRLERLLDRVTLEWGVVLGAVLGLVGLAAFVVALLRWREAGFGELRVDDMRVPLAGMVLVITGGQCVMVSFMLSLTRVGES